MLEQRGVDLRSVQSRGCTLMRQGTRRGVASHVHKRQALGASWRSSPRLTGRVPCASRPGAWHPEAALRLQPWLLQPGGAGKPTKLQPRAAGGSAAPPQAVLLARDTQLRTSAPWQPTAAVGGREQPASSGQQHADKRHPVERPKSGFAGFEDFEAHDGLMRCTVTREDQDTCA